MASLLDEFLSFSIIPIGRAQFRARLTCISARFKYIPAYDGGNSTSSCSHKAAEQRRVHGYVCLSVPLTLSARVSLSPSFRELRVLRGVTHEGKIWKFGIFRVGILLRIPGFCHLEFAEFSGNFLKLVILRIKIENSEISWNKFVFCLSVNYIYTVLIILQHFRNAPKTALELLKRLKNKTNLYSRFIS